MRQQDFAWVADIDEILCQHALMADFLEPFQRTINGATTPIQRQAVLWCVENLVPLSQARSNDWLLCCYEELFFDRDEAFDRVFHGLGLEPTAETRRAKTRAVSNPTHDLRPRVWHAPLTEAEGEEVLRICEAFGLTMYGRQMMPLCTPRDLVQSGLIGGTPTAHTSNNPLPADLGESTRTASHPSARDFHGAPCTDDPQYSQSP